VKADQTLSVKIVDEAQNVWFVSDWQLAAARNRLPVQLSTILSSVDKALSNCHLLGSQSSNLAFSAQTCFTTMDLSFSLSSFRDDDWSKSTYRWGFPGTR
jgi:hypothetical protein